MLFIIRVCFVVVVAARKKRTARARPIVEGGGGIVTKRACPVVSFVVHSPGQVCVGGLTSFLSCDQASGLFSIVVFIV